MVNSLRAGTSNTAAKSVIIAGCGIGGATLAIALLQRGFKVRVFEQARTLKELGAGLTLQASAMRVFGALGFWEQVRDITAHLASGCHVHYRTGEILTGTPDEDWLHKPASVNDMGHTHRGIMHQLLLGVIAGLDPDAVVTGTRVESFIQDANGVTVFFADGGSARADMLVGADGVKSVIRKALWGEGEPSFTGVVAFRCIVQSADVSGHLSGGRCVNFTGPGRGFLRYGVCDATMINCVGLVHTRKYDQEGWDNVSSRAEIMQFYGDFHPDVVALIDHAPEDTMFKWALYDRDPASVWSQGRVTLLGDAAHPTLPYHGQGAAQAVEDAMILARTLETYDRIEDAFARYEAVRVPRSSEIVLASRQQGAAINQPDPYRYGQLRSVITHMHDYDPVRVEI